MEFEYSVNGVSQRIPESASSETRTSDPRASTQGSQATPWIQGLESLKVSLNDVLSKALESSASRTTDDNPKNTQNNKRSLPSESTSES